MREPTEQEAQAFCAHMAQVHGFKYGDKSKAPEMALVAQFLPMIGVKLAPDVFLKRYSTTIGLYVYLADELTPWERIVVVTHEAVHVEQCRAALGPRWLAAMEEVAAHVADELLSAEGLGEKLLAALSSFSWGYLWFSEVRCADECHAYQAHQCLSYWRTGRVCDRAALVESLGHYGLTPADLAQGNVALHVSEASAARGVLPAVTPTDATAAPLHTALAYLDAHLGDVREPSAPSSR